MRQSSILVAQITDTHLFAHTEQRLLGLPTQESLQAVLQQVKSLNSQPDLLLLTGDLSQDGSAQSYERLQQMICPLGIPAYWLPGNHDNPTMMAQVLTRSPMSPKKSLHVGGWHILLLDSSVPGCVHGELTQASLNWLDYELSQTQDEPALITFHHPPFQVGSDWMDGIGLRNAKALFTVCDRHPRVRLVLFGHIHQEFTQHRHGVAYLGTPSTCIQFKPNSTNFALDEEQPGLRLTRLFPDGTWDSSIQRIVYTAQPDLAAAGY
ncbi:MAG: 3',5'-cyclic-AMP phosphodiesterase [Leptolyngbyaceae cyanobacterium bins.349]|nr:3',5'-cyclic-AMP phosphodiesterase [Leptolyngbyaceae cyanobacterium bins.349]